MTDTNEAPAAEAAPLRARHVAPWTHEAPTGLLVLADGTVLEGMESASLTVGGVRGCVLRAEITEPSNWRAAQSLDAWLKGRGIIAVTGIDTRALAALIRDKGMPNAVIAHAADGKFDLTALKREAAAAPSMVRR